MSFQRDAAKSTYNNFGYNFTKKISGGFNIDAVGFSFGKKQAGIYFANNNASRVLVNAKPTSFNLLLISDTDKGSFNNEFFAKYKWNDSWCIRLAFSFCLGNIQLIGGVNNSFRLQ